MGKNECAEVDFRFFAMLVVEFEEPIENPDEQTRPALQLLRRWHWVGAILAWTTDSHT
jgi:hypothetical protein